MAVTIALVVPGLFEPPEASIDQLVAAKLQTLLSRAHPQTIAQIHYESVLGSLLGCGGQNGAYLPLAAIDRYAMDDSKGWSHCVRADPVHLQVDRDHIRLLPAQLVNLSMDEATQLIDTINNHLRSDGLTLECGASDRWYLGADTAIDIDMQPPGYAAGRIVSQFMPTGESSSRWKSLLTEIQMLLHNHPVNLARVERGELAVNSLWLWGSGSLPVVDGNNTSTVITDDLLPKQLAKFTAASVHAVRELDNQSMGQSNLILVSENMYQAAILGQAADWVAAVKDFEQRYLSVVMNALKKRRINELSVYPCNGERWEVGANDLWKFWRRRKSLKSILTQGD